MSDTVISVENLSKRYIIGHQRSKGDGIRHVIEDALRAPLRLLQRRREQRKQEHEEFWAVKDLSFEIKRGEVVGIIGRNGAGKSTLLKLLSRITEPTHGRIQLDGRVASLLEVGTGFHPELTGRENIFLNGAILGMSRVEIRQKFDEIVAFSEIEKFLDTPVKRYSSGMYVRLAFAVAAHLEPEILIIDEVLAVGDAQFQNKCLGKMKDVSSSGRTVLFVSHNMAAVSSLCNRAVWLQRGQLRAQGEAQSVITEYYNANSGRTDESSLPLDKKPRTGSGAGRFTTLTIKLRSEDSNSRSTLYTGDNVQVAVEVVASAEVRGANVGVTFYDSSSTRLVDFNTALKGEFLTLAAGQKASIVFDLHDLRLRPGIYTVELWLGRGGIEDIDFVRNADIFEVHANPAEILHTETFPGPYQCRFEHRILR